MNVTETLALAMQLEVNIVLKPRELKLSVTPRERITEELREGIRANRDEIKRTLLHREAGKYLTRLTKDKSPEVQDAAIKAFGDRAANLDTSLDLGIAGHESSLQSPEVVRTILLDAMKQARKAVLRAEEDRKLEETGVIQSERQVFALARESLA